MNEVIVMMQNNEKIICPKSDSDGFYILRSSTLLSNETTKISANGDDKMQMIKGKVD